MGNISIKRTESKTRNLLGDEDVILEDTRVLCVTEHSTNNQDLDFKVPLYDIKEFLNFLEKQQEMIENNTQEDNSLLMYTEHRNGFYCSVCTSIKEDSDFIRFIGQKGNFTSRSGMPVVHVDCLPHLINKINSIKEENKEEIEKAKKRRVLREI